METDGNKLYVHDVSNSRIISYSLQSDSSKVVNVRGAFPEFEVYKNRIYGFSPPGVLMQVSLLNDDEILITVYDSEFNKLRSFGKYLTVVDELTAGLSWPLIEISNDIVHVSFKYFPIYRAYSTDGTLLTEIDLTEISSLKDPLESTDEDNYAGNRPSGFSSVIKAMDIYKDRIFMARTENTLFIDEFKYSNKNLEYIRSYTYDDLPDIYYVTDFFYHKESNSFYITEYNVDLKVTVYSIPD